MAKELPYFKFFCSEWNDGDITLESYETQGLFINVCSYYWSNNCDVSIKKLKKKFKEDKLIDYLIKEELIKIDSGLVVINFLIEQLGERDNLSNQNSINAKKRWDAIRLAKQLESESNAIASDSQSDIGTESMQYREEKKREEKKREETNKALPFSFYNSLINYGFDKGLVSDWLKVRKTKKSTNTETAFKGFINQVEKSKSDKDLILKTCIEKSWAGFKAEWMDNVVKSEDKPFKYEW